MVAAEDGYPAFVLDLEEQDVEEGLDTVKAPINVIAHEEIVGALGRRVEYWKLAADLENLEEVIELSVGVSADGHGSPHVHHVRLGQKYFLCLPH